MNKFREKIKHQKEAIQLHEDCTTEEITRKYFEESNKLNELLLQEELYWKQRAKTFWIAEGDSNSKFFHAFATTRKKLNHVVVLKNNDGEAVSNHKEMCCVVKNYFLKIFDSTERPEEEVSHGSDSVMLNEQNIMLEAELSFDEFTTAIKQMHPNKVSGPDGLNPAFFQHFWKLLGHEVFQGCKNWLNECAF